jgi:hypothetical protein
MTTARQETVSDEARTPRIPAKLNSAKTQTRPAESTFEGTPVLDVKPFIPGYDSTSDAKLPDWLVKAKKERQTNR